MFILRSTHLSQIRALEDRIKGLEYVLSAKETAYKEQRQLYRDQVEDLRALVFPKNSKDPHPMDLEADAVISGSDKPIEVSEEEHNRILEESREMDLLFSGNYSEDLLQ